MILVPFFLGWVGYYFYYKQTGTYVFMAPLYSTIRLFTMGFDANARTSAAGSAVSGWIFVVLYTARYLAILPAGTVLSSLLRPLIREFISKARYSAWSMRKKKILIIGYNEENL